jgi:hypothetical protein
MAKGEFAHALGIVDQTRAAHEMAAYSIPTSLVLPAFWSGRLVQLIGASLLLVRKDWLAACGCVLLVSFLAPRCCSDDSASRRRWVRRH